MRSNYRINKRTGKLEPSPLLERDITKAIRTELKRMGVWHFKVMGGLGQQAGLPDLICCVGGVLLGIEVKTQRGRVSEKQQEIGDQIRRSGGVWIVAKDTATVRDAIKIILGRGKGSQGEGEVG